MSVSADNNSVIRVALVEDDVTLRLNLEHAIQQAARLQLDWSASSLKEAQWYFRRAHDVQVRNTASRGRLIPDVVLVDLGLPDGSGAELIAQFAAAGVRFLVVTVFDDRANVLRAIRSGADGYLVKDSQPDEIVSAIETLAEGGSPISASAAIHIMGLVREVDRSRDEGQPAELLTPRETELLELFAKGLTYREAADSLSISRHTVGDYVKSIYRKLSVNSRSEAIYEAMHYKLISVGGTEESD